MGADAADPVVGVGAGAALAALFPESDADAEAFSPAVPPEAGAEEPPEVSEEEVVEPPSSLTPLR